MNLLSEIDTFLSKRSLNPKFHFPSACFSLLNPQYAEDESSTSPLTLDYIKNIVNRLDRLEEDGKNEEATQLEWLSTVQILKYFDTLDQTIDASLALNIANVSIRKLKIINDKRFHLNLGHFLVITEMAIRFYREIADYKTEDHKVKQKIMEQGSWLVKNLEAVAAYGEEHIQRAASFQGLSIVDIMKLYFKNMSRLVIAHPIAIKQQNKALQKKAFRLLYEYRYDKEFSHACIELIATLTEALSGGTNKSTLDARLKLYFSNLVYLFDLVNPRKDKEALLTEFNYDQAFFSREEATPGMGPAINLLFPVDEIMNQNRRISLEEVTFFSESIYELIIRVLNESLRDDLMLVNILYNLRVIERILTSDTEQIKSKKKSFEVEKGLTSEDYITFSTQLKSLCLKLIRFIIIKFKGYMVKHLDWTTNALYYLFVNFKENCYILKRIIRVVGTMLETLGSRATSFARFLFFKGGNLFEILEKLFVSLFVKKPEMKQEQTFASKKGAKNKKKGGPLTLQSELRLQLTESNQLSYLDSFTKSEKIKLFTSLLKVLVEYLKLSGKQEVEIDISVKIDNFAEMIMNSNLGSYTGLNLEQKLQIASILESVALNNITNKQESMVFRSVLNYLGRFIYHYGGHEITERIKEIQDRILSFHENKTGLVMEHQSLEELYSYYDTKIKIMSALEKRPFEQLEVEQEEDEDDVIPEEKPSKKIDNKDGVEVHNKLFESEKKVIVNEQVKKTFIEKKGIEQEVVQIRREEVKESVTKGKMQVETVEVIQEEVKVKGTSDVDISDMPQLIFDDDE